MSNLRAERLTAILNNARAAMARAAPLCPPSAEELEAMCEELFGRREEVRMQRDRIRDERAKLAGVGAAIQLALEAAS